jgi:hypothetical protein
MDSVIDTMAKRRIALKRLGQEQPRASTNEPQYSFNGMFNKKSFCKEILF